MEFFVLWVGLSVVIAAMAHNRGRSGFGWFWLSLLISPLVALIAVLVAGEHKEAIDGRALADGTMRKCPQCAELVRVEAKICKHCRSDISTETAS